MSLKFNFVSKEFLEAIKDNPKKGTSPYDTVADVVRIEGNTAWIHIAGGVEETPAQMTINCEVGDKVQVRVGGGTAWITGNATAPPTDDKRANDAYVVAKDASEDALTAMKYANNAEFEATRAHEQADIAQGEAERAYQYANQAEETAEIATDFANNALTKLATVEDVVDVLNWITEHGTYKASTDTEVVLGKYYFTRSGAGTTSNPYVYTVVENPSGNPSAKGYYELDSVDEAVSNYISTHLALTDEGLYLIKDGSGYKLKLTNNGMYIISPNGNVANQTTSDGNTIRATNGTVIAHLGYGEGNTESGTANAPYYTLGIRLTTDTAYSSNSTYKVGDLCVHNNKIYVCIEDITTSESWNQNHWQYYIGNYSFVGGSNLIASGNNSHAEGNSVNINGVTYNNASIGPASHTEGSSTIAIGYASHAEGSRTKAIGMYSHSSGDCTIANAQCQTVIGRYNVPQGDPQSADNSDYAFILGNGFNESQRSNALTIDFKGNVNIASGAKYKINGSNLSASDIANSVTGVKGNSESSYRTGNVNLTPANIGAVPTTRTVNNKALSSNITLSASDIGAIPATSFGDYVIEEGNYDGWYIRKWESGKCEMWKYVTQTVTAYDTGAFILGSSSTTQYPISISSPMVQAYLRKAGTGGGYISYDYERTDYWSGIAFTKASHPSGTSVEIKYSLYVLANCL